MKPILVNFVKLMVLNFGSLKLNPASGSITVNTMLLKLGTHGKPSFEFQISCSNLRQLLLEIHHDMQSPAVNRKMRKIHQDPIWYNKSIWVYAHQFNRTSIKMMTQSYYIKTTRNTSNQTENHAWLCANLNNSTLHLTWKKLQNWPKKRTLKRRKKGTTVQMSWYLSGVLVHAS